MGVSEGGLRADVPKVPYEQVDAGRTQDEMRHKLECAEREEAELRERLAQVQSVGAAAAAALRVFQSEVVDADVVDDDTRTVAHEHRLKALVEENESGLSFAREQVAQHQAVLAACRAGLKALEADRSQGDGGAAG